MSTAITMEAGSSTDESVAAAVPISGFSWRRRGTARLLGRRFWIDCAAAMSVGAAMASAWAITRPADDRTEARRALIERRLAQMSPALAEVERLERSTQTARANAAVAAARARPFVELRTLLETLSRLADAGVTVTRVRQSSEGFELQIRAIDSATCAQWADRLAHAPGWQAAEISDLRQIDGKGERAVQATVRLASRAAAPKPGHGRTGPGRDEPAGRSDR